MNDCKVAAHIPPSVSLLGSVHVLDDAAPRAGDPCNLKVQINLDCEVKEGQTVELWRHFVSDMQVPQIDNPQSPAYFTAKCDDAPIETYIDPLQKVHGEGAFFPYRRIAGVRFQDDVESGATVEFGLRNITMQTYEEEVFNLRFTLMEDDELQGYFGDALYTVLGSQAESLRLIAPSCVSAGDCFETRIVTCDRFGNKSGDELNDLSFHLSSDEGGPVEYETIEYDHERRLHVVKGVHLEEEDVHYLRAEVNQHPDIRGVSNPIAVREEWEEQVLWGDLHQHAYYLDGRGSPKHNYRYAANTSCLDFCAVCPHQVGTVTPPRLYLEDVPVQQGWDEMVEAANEYEDDIVTILGSEVNGFRGSIGDLNSYYLDFDNRPEIERLCQKRGVDSPEDAHYADIEEYLSILEDSKGDVLLLPHAHASGGPERADMPRRPYITNFEACSVHGNFENYYQVWLKNDWKIGVHGGSDNHMPSTGNAQPGSHYPNTNGLTGAWAEEKSREGVWNAYKQRRTYAVTGNQHILLDYRVGCASMGEIADCEARKVTISVAGTSPILSVELVREGEVIRSYHPETDWRDYLRILWTDNLRSRRVDDSHTSGRIESENANLELKDVMCAYNRTDEFREVDGGIDYRSNAYSGSWRGCLLGVDGAQLDSIQFSICDSWREQICLKENLNLSVSNQRNKVQLPFDSDAVESVHTYEVDPVRAKTLVWLDWIDPDWSRVLNLDWDVEPGPPCYVRVRQTDGNEAWSSAIWWEQ